MILRSGELDCFQLLPASLFPTASSFIIAVSYLACTYFDFNKASYFTAQQMPFVLQKQNIAFKQLELEHFLAK